MAGPFLSAGGQAIGPTQRRNFDARPYFVVSGQYLSCQRGGWFWSPVIYVAPFAARTVTAQSDEKTTQNDEITTHDSSLRKSRAYTVGRLT